MDIHLQGQVPSAVSGHLSLGFLLGGIPGGLELGLVLVDRARDIHREHQAILKVFRRGEIEPAVEALMSTAREWAARLAAGPTLAIGASKLGMQRALHSTFRDTLHWEAMMISLVAQTADATEGLTAFFQKRKPEFGGR